MVDRRDFLRLGAGTALGLAARPASGAGRMRASAATRTLGRTGLKISDISFGSASNADPAVVRHALAQGINYFDTGRELPLGQLGGGDRRGAEGQAQRRVARQQDQGGRRRYAAPT